MGTELWEKYEDARAASASDQDVVVGPSPSIGGKRDMNSETARAPVAGGYLAAQSVDIALYDP
jgi:hypothetical protein